MDRELGYVSQGLLSAFLQMIYGGFSCTQGWFCTPFSSGVKNVVRLFIKRQQTNTKEWEQVEIPSK
jgi:diacylglycerol kinase (ATP)